jgi:hypothetical protein
MLKEIVRELKLFFFVELGVHFTASDNLFLD